MVKSGIYAIFNLETRKVYIGSAVNMQRRWHIHLSLLRRGLHHSSHLQRAWNKGGSAAFDFGVLEEVETAENLISREQWWINKTKSFLGEFGYNVNPTAGTTLGSKRTDITRAKMSASLKGKPSSMLGRRHSVETRAKMSAAQAGNKFPLGCKRSSLTKIKMSAAQKGNSNGLGNKSRLGQKNSAETRAKISASNSGKVIPEAVKAKIGQKLTGNKNGVGNKSKSGQRIPQETRIKMSEAQKLRRLKEKGLLSV